MHSNPSFRRRARRGVSLVELMVALGISAIVMTAVFSAFLFLARSSLLTTAYSGMDDEARVGLEIFGRDVRMANGIVNPGGTLLTDKIYLRLPTGKFTPEIVVVYEYDAATRTFYRNRGKADERALIHGVDVFVLKHFSIREDPSTGLPDEAINITETKQIQIQLRARRDGVSRASATNNVISARYILRNKFIG